MIVDTSALIAIAEAEPGSDALIDAIADGGLVPAPVLVEFRRVVTKRGLRVHPGAEIILSDLLTRLSVEPFTAGDADIAGDANMKFGAGNGRGGTLNLLDLMVYAVARRTGRPILCTGRDFSATDAHVHRSSLT